MEKVAALLTLTLMRLGLFAVEGFTITKLWHWYMVPTFGLKEITFTVALGIGLLVSLITSGHTTYQILEELDHKTSMDQNYRIVGYRVGVAGAALLTGWILTFF